MTTRLRSVLHRQRGVTLTELMIALVLGALVVLAATAMVVTSRGTYRTQDESTRLAESSRFGLELSNRLVRLAGYTNFGDNPSPPPAYPEPAFIAWKVAPDSYAMTGPAIVGSNNSVPGGGPGINGSDSLTIRFYGTSQDGTTTLTNGGTPDGNVLDCTGTAIPSPLQPSPTNDASAIFASARSYNVLFVGLDVDNEPALMCRRQVYDGVTGNPSGFVTSTLIRGVENFQVLYGEAIPQGFPNGDLDFNLPGSIVYRTGIGGTNAVVNWENVVAVRISMLLRSGVGARPDAEATSTVYNMFGITYPATGDPGANFTLATVGNADRTRARRIVQTTVFVRNRVSVWPSLQQ